VAIIGANGVGKSTLLKVLVGEHDADDGTATWGYEADFGYFPQDHHDALGTGGTTVAESLWDVVPMDPVGAIYGRLAEVLFSRDDADKDIEHLSGGEAARLLFARIAATQPTVMVLDEPTNHLDLEGIASLAKGLQRYDGTLLFVSHDRWFVDAVATRIIEIKPDGIDDFRGTYAEWLQRAAEADHLDRSAVVQAERDKRRKKKKGKGDNPAPTPTEAPAAPSPAAPGTRNKRKNKKRRR
jgi:ATPase subunit of ABC transporter with duplicated ATPase domains